MSSGIKAPTPKTEPTRTDAVPNAASFSNVDGVPKLDPEYGDKPSPYSTRADFRDIEFTRVIRQHGKFVTWRKAMPCPCLEETTGQPGMNCAYCDGSGWYYIDPQNIQALMMAVDKSVRLHERFGIWLSGTTSITVEPQHRVGFRDSLSMRDSVMTYSEILKKGNRRGIRQKLPLRTDSCRYRIVNLIQMFMFRDNAIVTLSKGIHFKITENGWIEWTIDGDSMIAPGTPISVRYEFNPIFIVESFPHVLRDDVTLANTTVDKVYSLPVQSVGKLDFLLDANTVLPSAGGI